MMREVLDRRFARALREQAASDAGEGAAPALPDLVLIDGGAGQLSAVRGILQDLGHAPDPGGRRSPRGRTATPGASGSTWTAASRSNCRRATRCCTTCSGVRDETHRFAITTHRAGRSKALVTSELDEVPGVGAARKRALLNHFGSARGVKQAGLTDLEAAPGINRETARRVYVAFSPRLTSAAVWLHDRSSSSDTGDSSSSPGAVTVAVAV